MDAKSCGSISSWCIGLKAGPAGFPERVRPGATGCPPAVSGVINPSSAVAIYLRVLLVLRSSRRCPRIRVRLERPASAFPSSCKRDPECVEGLPFDNAQGNLERDERLRGPAPRGYNGD